MKLEFTMETISNKEYISRYIVKNCIEKGNPYFFGKVPGARYQSQYYLAKGLYNVDFMKKVTEEFYDIIKKEVGHFNFQITGREWSSIPLITNIPLYLNLKYDIHINSFMIKRERKTYGIHNFIEGMPNELPVIIVDDLCNSTNSFKFCHDILKKEKLEILPFIFAVLNKHKFKINNNYMNEDRYLKNNIKPLTIVTGDDIENAIRRTKN